jgi:DUF3014 family protein
MAARGPTVALAAIAIAAIVGAGGWYWWKHREPPFLPPPPPAPQVEAKPEAPIGPKHPIAVESAVPLPALKDSDGAVVHAGIELLGKDALQRFFNLEDLVRHIVVTVDNLPRETVAPRLNPVAPMGGAFVTQGKEATLAISADNAARYTPFVHLIERLDAKKAASVYMHFYPLFQQAYEELGYPGKYFNDRLVEAIDNLLEAPEIDGPIALTVPHVLYEFRDPQLESRSAGQKALMRVGRANEAALKKKLRELRQEVAAGVSKP